MSVFVNLSVGLSFRAPAREPASVTSSPSRIQVMPSATMTRLWKRPQGSRSSRGGMSVSTMPGATVLATGSAMGRALLTAVQRRRDGRVQTSAAFAERGIERHASVDEEGRAGDVVALVRGEPDRRLGDVLGVADAAVGDELEERRLGLRRLPGGAVDR